MRLEWLVHSPVRAEMEVQTPFGDDTSAYTRVALAALHQAKRNKAGNSHFIGLEPDGTGAQIVHGCLHHL